MTAAFARVSRIANADAPRAAVVLGSGLGGGTAHFRELARVGFGEVPGLVPPTVHGHTGQLAVGTWADTPVLVFFGRVHFYEGHSYDVVSAPVRVAAALGARTLILTNAAGGIHPALGPGDLMAIREHVALLGRESWRALAAGSGTAAVYSPRLIRAMQEHGAAAGRELRAGVYAALTGPCYETPAEIRALRTCGVDAVGMSTVIEAETAAALGLEVAAVSCVTNKAAGLAGGGLDHADVLDNAELVAGRLGELIGTLVRGL
ncbi:MAG: purine-nucleoside phosphorylase [Gemmataceae bacterium]|nr:purine-nucleoside phosphorylase [Gemmataceae bacterium]